MTSTSDTPPISDRRSRAVFAVVLLFFFLSGTCGLLYQVVWTRKLVLLFGTTSYAVATVLSIFFLGLGIGSVWGGRLADRTDRPLYLYGLLEIAVGIWALLFIVSIDAGEAAVVGALRSVEQSRALGIIARALLSTGFLIVPVTLMGATLPLLAKFVTEKESVRGFRIGTLYSINTFGAVIGCAATGFYLLARLGYTRATLLGAAINIGVGLAAIALARAALPSRADDADAAEAASPELTPVIGTGVAVLAVSAFALSGFCSLALEVLWTRLLTIVFTGTTYAFTTMLTTVLCGIALGSAAASILIDRTRHSVTFFGVVQVLTGASCLFMLTVFPSLPERLQDLLFEGRYEWEQSVRAKFFLSFLVLFVPTFFFGMSFPCALRIVVSSRSTLGREVGRIYSANTLGGVLGSAVAGFAVIPLLGTHLGIVLTSLLISATGVLMLAACPTFFKPGKAALVTASIALVAYAATSAPANVSRAVNTWYVPDDHEIIHFSEGLEGTVVVTAPVEETHGSERVLWINAVQATASIEKGVKMNRFQGVIPFLFDRDLKQGLFMCFGSGVTMGTLGIGELEHIDAVEISEDVLDAAEHFAVDNFNVRENPKVRFNIDDGRNFLLRTRNRYDLISFEPMPLALSGVSTFYTREYYEACKKHLNPGGLVSQWVPLHGLRPDIVRSLINTFVSVFPESSAWYIHADLFLIGSNHPLKLDYNHFETILNENDALRGALDAVNLADVPELMASFVMNKENLARYAEGAPIMTDDRPWAEFVAPKTMYEQNVDECLRDLRPLMEPPTVLMNPADYTDWNEIKEILERRHRAHVQDTVALEVYYGGTAYSRPEVDFEKSLEIDPNDYNARYYLTEIGLARARMSLKYDAAAEAIEPLLAARNYSPRNLDVHLLLGDAYFETGQTDAALDSYRLYLDLGGSKAHAVERVSLQPDTPNTP